MLLPSPSHGGTSPSPAPAQAQAQAQAPVPPRARAEASRPTRATRSATPFTPQACAAAQGQAFGGAYTSTQLASVFGLNQLFGQGRTGVGQTIAIVEFEQYLQSDFNAFESCYGLDSPSATSRSTAARAGLRRECRRGCARHRARLVQRSGRVAPRVRGARTTTMRRPSISSTPSPARTPPRWSRRAGATASSSSRTAIRTTSRARARSSSAWRCRARP